MPLSADEIRQSFFGEHGIAAENSEYLLRQFLPKDRDAYFDDIRNTQPACKWLLRASMVKKHVGSSGRFLTHPRI